LKRKKNLEKKKYNSKITETGVEIVSQAKGCFVLLLLKTYNRPFSKEQL